MNMILCDECEKNITYTGKMPSYRLHLSVESLPHNTPTVYLVSVKPPIKKDLHFCGLDCLRAWARR